jgi:hypothetical protein
MLPPWLASVAKLAASTPSSLLTPMGCGIVESSWCLGSVVNARVSCLHPHRVIQGGPAASVAVASCPSWRTANAMKIWEKPRNSAKKPTQNKIR